MTREPFWKPTKTIIERSNIYKMMKKHGFVNYSDFWNWSVNEKSSFLRDTISALNIQFKKNYSEIVDLSKGVEAPVWLKGAELNIVDSCFQNNALSPAIIYGSDGKAPKVMSQQELLLLVNRIANGLKGLGLKEGDSIAIDMPMTPEAVAIYLAGIKAGLPIVTIADSFTPNEIAVRIRIASPKVIFTQAIVQRAGKELELYKKVVASHAPKAIVLSDNNKDILREGDLFWADFLSDNSEFESVIQTPESMITVLFSSGTTGEPKAIPWKQTTPLKCAMDAYYHQDIHQNDVVCWPTNLGWMMGPWLVFAALINKAAIALYSGAPTETGFGAFVQEAKVTMLGVIPSIVKYWKNSACMEDFNWNSIRCFSSTGEVSNPLEMEYLMSLANNKPVIEYCGGTEIGGGYVTSTVVQPNIASAFSTQALGGEFVLLNDDSTISKKGELFLIPPILGNSNSLLNRNHHEVYFKGTPVIDNQKLRRHGDQLEQLENGYFIAQGRVDDSMNLGGIKVSSVQIEKVLNELEFIKESAAIAANPKGGGPSVLVVYYVESTENLTASERQRACQSLIRKKLNPLFKIKTLIKIDALPRTASNKVIRRKLRELYENQ
jgi:acetyl-CoA synthetase